MADVYQPCPCGSGKKLKFCCFEKTKGLNRENPRMLIHRSLDFKVQECLINKDWQESGLASIFVVRSLPNGKFLFATYLVDIFCLGLKNTFCNANVTDSVIQGLISHYPEELIPADYEDIRSIILGAIEYAAGLGFEPNEDWVDSKFVVEGQRGYSQKFEFGKGGKPFYIQGPEDDPIEIMTKLGTRFQTGTADVLIEADENSEQQGLTQNLAQRFRKRPRGGSRNGNP